MATKKFLLQGFTSDTHLCAVERLFECPDLERMILSVAFVNKAGVDLLAPKMEGSDSEIDFFAGIRNDITSRQGLDLLMGIGANVHYVDTGDRHRIFHPKIYFARGKIEARMVVGSANFTPGGLNNNIEASVTLDLDLSNADDLALADSVDAEFAKLTTDYPEHVVRLVNTLELDKLQAQGRLLDEASSSPPRAVASGAADKADGLNRIKLKVTPLARTVRRSTLPQPVASDAPAPTTLTLPSASIGTELELVWESKPLTKRDLTIPSGVNTNATGSINLDKGLLDKNIDHRHFFRDEVFPALNWKTTNKPTVDEAFAQFGLIVKGVGHGEFKLRIGHTTSTTSTTYAQRNAMTRLSWKLMKKYVARKDLIGRTMFLYRDVSDLTRFVIEID